MRKLRPKRFCIGFKCGGTGIFKGQDHKGSSSSSSSSCNNNNIKWEVRPGGMLVQKRSEEQSVEDLITVRVFSTVSQFWHEISIDANSTFGEMKMVISIVSGMKPKEQRILYKGKEREDSEYLHMVGVRDRDKVLLFEDPAIKEMKLLTSTNLPITV